MRGAARNLLAELRGPNPRHEPDYWLLATVLTLVMFGTVMVFSASFAIGVQQANGDGYYYLKRQVVWASIGLLGLLVASQIDFHFWRRFSVLGMVVIAILLAAVVFVPGLGSGGETWGANRWIPLGPLAFQPSEVAKLALVIYLADWLGQKGDRIRQVTYGLIPFGLMLGVIILLVMKEPDLGTSTLLAAIGISVFLVAGASLIQFGALISAGLAVFMALALSASYRRARILIFLHPDADPRNLGWQLGQARLGLGSGGIFGLGLGASRQKFSWLPEAHTDAIFAVIGEELGLVGCVFVLLLFAALAWRGYRIAIKAPDTFGTLIGVGIVTWMIFQAAINIGGITLTIPFTGIPLPFISYGGTSLAVSLTAIGILLNISRQTVDRPQPAPEPAAAPVHHRSVRAATARRVEPRPVSRRAPAAARDPVRTVDGRAQSRGGSFGRSRRRR
ncbi:MAG TPA: putative lipid II flippase FtsW [Thermomicrobiaceae bacterium]|nr:putative lipid II flippase FtsW [Thermomicrobiaceae bacterium]